MNNKEIEQRLDLLESMMNNVIQTVNDAVKLERKVDGLEEDESEYYFLEVCDSLLISYRDINELLSVTEPLPKNTMDKSHGLGVFKSKEYAEMARAALIFVLDLAKRYEQEARDLYGSEYTFNEMVEAGNALIKEMEGRNE